MDDEYPSNVYPWSSLEKQGHEIIYAKHKEVVQAISENKDPLGIVSLSPVHWITGGQNRMGKTGKAMFRQEYRRGEIRGQVSAGAEGHQRSLSSPS